MEVLDFFVNFMSLDIDGRERTGRTKVLAGATAYAPGLVDHGNHGREFVRFVELYHLDGTHRTMPFAVAAFHTVGNGYAVLFHPNGMAYLCARLLRQRDGLDGTCRADFSASVAFRTAVAALVAHRGLHQ